jgi:hypothetical protein
MPIRYVKVVSTNDLWTWKSSSLLNSVVWILHCRPNETKSLISSCERRSSRSSNGNRRTKNIIWTIILWSTRSGRSSQRKNRWRRSKLSRNFERTSKPMNDNSRNRSGSRSKPVISTPKHCSSKYRAKRLFLMKRGIGPRARWMRAALSIGNLLRTSKKRGTEE